MAAPRAERKRRATLRHEGWAGGHLRPLDIRKGDNVEVISGKDKGKRGVVERILPEQQRIAVRGVNLLKRHTRSGVKGNIQGGIVDFDGPVSYSNIMLVCNRCEKRTRIGHGVDALGRRVIVCKKCGEHYERAQV
jgi:large subunit ribosomal protein L24